MEGSCMIMHANIWFLIILNWIISGTSGSKEQVANEVGRCWKCHVRYVRQCKGRASKLSNIHVDGKLSGGKRPEPGWVWDLQCHFGSKKTHPEPDTRGNAGGTASLCGSTESRKNLQNWIVDLQKVLHHQLENTRNIYIYNIEVKVADPVLRLFGVQGQGSDWIPSYLGQTLRSNRTVSTDPNLSFDFSMEMSRVP